MRVIIVHNVWHVKTALEAAQQLNCEVTLQSAPDAVFYAGALYLLRMFEQEKANFPDVNAQFILDCAASRAKAIEATQTGYKHIRSNAPEPIRKKLAAIAAEQGISFHAEPYEALDLQPIRATKDAIIKWLTGEP